MTKGMLLFLQHLRDFGLVYQRKVMQQRSSMARCLLINRYFLQRKDSRFYPTRLAINLISGLRDRKADANKPGYAIVETNYRVYAYTGAWTLPLYMYCILCANPMRMMRIISYAPFDSIPQSLLYK